jgi:hypothetical protein
MMRAIMRKAICNRRIGGRGLSVTTVLGIGQAVARLTVIGIDHMTPSTARLAVITGLIIGPLEPHKGIIETGLLDVKHGDGDADAGAGATA